MTTVILFTGLLIYVITYLTYGKKLEKATGVNKTNKTPAETFYDGVDYIPAEKPVLFGHHFASIAGAAPIIGPVLAMAWGWVPAILWVWFGNIFIGATHDFLSIMASVRYDGKSIQFVATDLISRKSGKIFYWLVFFLLILVIAAFGAVVNGMFISQPSVASSYIFIIISALILGVMMYRLRWSFLLSTSIGIALLALSMYLGIKIPIAFPASSAWNAWTLILFFYIITASSIPVNVLLQPRDYLNSWLLYAGLLLGLIAAVFSFHGFTAPAFTSFAPIISKGQPTPFWPSILLIIACGSLSGFHSLVGSGTTSKQLKKESDALPVGYGSMLAEGFLSSIVIISIAAFGFEILKNAQTGLTHLNWSEHYISAMMDKYPKAAMFIKSYAAMIDSTFLRVIPSRAVEVLAGMWVASFALTTLDTTNRLARYTLSEILIPVKKTSLRLYDFLTDKWIASIIPASIGMWLAWSKNFTVIWPSFSTANQLIASVAMLTGVIWLKKRVGVSDIKTVLYPALFLWITVTAAIIWFCVKILPATIKSNPVTGAAVSIIEIVMLVMNFIFIYDFYKSWKNLETES